LGPWSDLRLLGVGSGEDPRGLWVGSASGSKRVGFVAGPKVVRVWVRHGA